MAVFVEEQKVPPWEEMDHYDEEATHYLVEDGLVAAATARIVDKGERVGKIGRVAVLKEYRGSGVGSRLMEHVLADNRERFCCLILDAQVQVIPFYERLGFAAGGDVFLDAGIEHRAMSLNLPETGKS
jgi:predicted GNAT family N-acyltransferase